MAVYEVYVRQTYTVEAKDAQTAIDMVTTGYGVRVLSGAETEDEVYNVTEDKYE